MAWIVGTRRKKTKLKKEGPKYYTECVLKKFIELSESPVERAAYTRALNLLRARKYAQYKRERGSIGLINSEHAAMLALKAFFEARLHKLNAEVKVRGKRAYARKVRQAFASLAQDISYQGDWQALASHLIRLASRTYGW